MNKYIICVVVPMETYITVEAETEEEALEKVRDTKEYEDIGSPCYQCVDHVGEPGETNEFVCDVVLGKEDGQ